MSPYNRRHFPVWRRHFAHVGLNRTKELEPLLDLFAGHGLDHHVVEYLGCKVGKRSNGDNGR